MGVNFMLDQCHNIEPKIPGQIRSVMNGLDPDPMAAYERSGSDPRNTNYAGGNTSAKGSETDPVTGGPVDLLWVKGSGGDLGTLTETGLAALRLDRLRALADVYPGIDREDEMVAAFDFCLHGRGGAAPSIDTAMHGLVDAAHVDHLHPDSGIALATAADGEALTKECFGHRAALRDAVRLSGHDVDVVHLVGGGARNALLCQLTADACDRPVVVGPVEATAIGNVLVQARANGGPADRVAARALVAASVRLRRYEPGGDSAAWSKAASAIGRE